MSSLMFELCKTQTLIEIISNSPWPMSALFVSLTIAGICSADNSSTATEYCVPVPSRHKMMSTIPIINNRNPNYGLSTFNQLFERK